MEVIIGTYNHVIFGFSFKSEEIDDLKNKKKWEFRPLFTDQGHAGCVKAVASNGRYLSSGSTDETIRLFDLKRHMEVGTLMEQSGSITCIAYCGTTHMLSGSEDGTICVWKTRTWELLKTLKGHRGTINSISVHPSGRLALSVAKDKNIKTWNLLTGRAAYTTNIKEVGELIRWSPKGDCYAIVCGCKVTMYKISGVDEPFTYTCEKYILSLEFLTDSVIVIGGESDDIIFYDFEKKIVLQRVEAHSVRTKSVLFADNPEDTSQWLMFTTASDGNLKAWSVCKDDLEKEPELLAALDMPGRPTCMTLKIPPELKKKEQEIVKEEQVQDVEDEESEEAKTTSTGKSNKKKNRAEGAKKSKKKKLQKAEEPS